MVLIWWRSGCSGLEDDFSDCLAVDEGVECGGVLCEGKDLGDEGVEFSLLIEFEEFLEVAAAFGGFAFVEVAPEDADE